MEPAPPADVPGDPEVDAGPSLVTLTLAVLVLLAALVGIRRILAPTGGGTAVLSSVNLLTAYLGGLLAFLSPCSVAVVPAFFAYGFETRGSLLRHTYAFYLGLSLVFVPLAVGASLVGATLTSQRDLIVPVLGVLLVVLGLLVAAGRDPFGTLAAGGAFPHRFQGSIARVLALGMVFGFATSSCTAPILGGIAALSVGSGLAPVAAVGLFLVFALGIVTPLFLLAWAEDRGRFLARLRARPRTMHVVGRTWEVHPVEAATGAFLVVLGALFIATDGTRGLLPLYDAVGATDLYERLNLLIVAGLGGWVGWVLGVAAVLALLAWLAARKRRRRAGLV